MHGPRQHLAAIVLILTRTVMAQHPPAEFSGLLTIREHKFAAGEPIEVLFKAKNLESVPMQVLVAHLYGPCGSPYEITVDGQKYTQPWPGHEIVLSCAYGSSLVRPGRRFQESFTIPKELSLLAQPGRHRMEVSRSLSYKPGDATLNGPWRSRTYTAKFEIVITDPPRPLARLKLGK